jgi:hypothetical protein
MHLSKSDFKLARECPTKLYYKKLGYPSKKSEDPYLKYLAEGGYRVEKLAKLLYPGGVELEYDRKQPEASYARVKAVLEIQDKAALFEACLVHEAYSARVDILEKDGNTLRVIEVKSASVNSDDEKNGDSPFVGKKGKVSSEKVSYIEDVAYQTWITRQLFPECEVVPYLMLLDSSKKVGASATFGNFKAAHSSTKSEFTVNEIEYIGDSEKLAAEHCLGLYNVSREVEQVMDTIEVEAARFAQSLLGDKPTKIEAELSAKCSKCEYRIEGEAKSSGFSECWGKLAEETPHILDLYSLGSTSKGKNNIVGAMAACGQVSLYEAGEKLLSGKLGQRREIQVTNMKKGCEWIDPALPKLLHSHPEPLHFIDFEASVLGIPPYEGMRPYEKEIFQWSCHTMKDYKSAKIDHKEWLNDETEFPNFKFARKLMEAIGDEGTVYIWSNYEIQCLNEIRRQMGERGIEDQELAGWLDRMTVKDNPRIVDLCKLALEHYFAPEMGGRVSIKNVLPAVWMRANEIQEMEAFSKYVKEENGKYIDPYKTLPELPIGGDEERNEVVVEGTGAMRAYQEMVHSVSRQSDDSRAMWKELLYQYCELDTAAMAIIALYWAGYL